MALNPPKPSRAGIGQRLLNLGPLRGLVAGKLRQQVSRKARRDHYPAPYAIIDLWRRYGDNAKRMLDAEARSIAELMCGETSRNLVRVFMLQDRLKSLGGKQRHEFKTVHVVGAGGHRHGRPQGRGIAGHGLPRLQRRHYDGKHHDDGAPG